jgi:hypothetical protein
MSGAIDAKVWSDAVARMVQAGYISKAPALDKALNTAIWQ